MFEIIPKEQRLNLRPDSLEAEIYQNIMHLLTTRAGERAYDRDFGIDYSFIDYPLLEAEAKARNEVLEKILRYEPRVVVKQIMLNSINNLTGGIVQKIVVELRTDVNR